MRFAKYLWLLFTLNISHIDSGTALLCTLCIKLAFLLLKLSFKGIQFSYLIEVHQLTLCRAVLDRWGGGGVHIHISVSGWRREKDRGEQISLGPHLNRAPT